MPHTYTATAPAPVIKDSQGRKIAVGDRVISYNTRYYNYTGEVVSLSPLNVKLDGGRAIEINRVDLEVAP